MVTDLTTGVKMCVRLDEEGAGSGFLGFSVGMPDYRAELTVSLSIQTFISLSPQLFFNFTGNYVCTLNG